MRGLEPRRGVIRGLLVELPVGVPSFLWGKVSTSWFLFPDVFAFSWAVVFTYAHSSSLRLKRSNRPNLRWPRGSRWGRPPKTQVSDSFLSQYHWSRATLVLVVMATDFLFWSAYRFLRSSAIDWCRGRPASSIGRGVHPVVAEAGQGASPLRVGGSPQASLIWGRGGSYHNK